MRMAASPSATRDTFRIGLNFAAAKKLTIHWRAISNLLTAKNSGWLQEYAPGLGGTP